MATTTTTSQSQSLVDFWGVITESKRIINSHSRHFLALSVLFLLPISFSLTVFPTLLHTFTNPTPNHTISLLRLSTPTPLLHHLHHLHHHHHHHKTLIFSLLFSASILLLSIAATASITYSVFHGFYGRPVKLVSSIASLRSSFLPLLATLVTTQISIFLILALFGTILFLSRNSPYFIPVSLIMAVLLGFSIVYVTVNWYLTNVIVVVEGKWGVHPMVRSKGLVRGMRWVALCLIMYFGFFCSLFLGISMVSGGGNSGSSINDGWSTCGFVVGTVVTCAALTLVLLHSIAASTVLYMYCKALHGELAGEIANEFGDEYVSLPFDDKKVPHVVYYVQ